MSCVDVTLHASDEAGILSSQGEGRDSGNVSDDSQEARRLALGVATRPRVGRCRIRDLCLLLLWQSKTGPWRARLKNLPRCSTSRLPTRRPGGFGARLLTASRRKWRAASSLMHRRRNLRVPSRSRITAIINGGSVDISTDLLLRVLVSLGIRVKPTFSRAA